MKKSIQPETYWRVRACLGVCFLLYTARVPAAPTPLVPTATGQLAFARYVAPERSRPHGPFTFTLPTNNLGKNGPCRALSSDITGFVTPSAVEGINGKRVDSTKRVITSPETTIVFIPEGFSPNNDGINDQFVIQQTGPPLTVSLDIFNRWGELVYQSDPYKNDWDGTANRGFRTGTTGQGLPDGTYFYAVRLSDGREFIRFLTLAR